MKIFTLKIKKKSCIYKIEILKFLFKTRQEKSNNHNEHVNTDVM